MLNSLSDQWVKNVYRLRIDRGTNGERLTTNKDKPVVLNPSRVNNSLTFNEFLTKLYTAYSTDKKRDPYPLSWYLYPQSTAPTNQ